MTENTSFMAQHGAITPVEELEETYSTEGPMCPGCGAETCADEASYYDERGYEIECDCGLTFEVEPFSAWSWTGRALSRKEKTDV